MTHLRRLLLPLLLVPAPLVAQRDVALADSLLRAGRVARAESVYYAAVAARPRDPAARLALGRYLASRGATRVGAVLIEEAQRFGASAGLAATHLAPLYARVGEWQALAKLSLAPLSAGERARASWLATNASKWTGPDSVSLPLGAPPSGSFGTIWIQVGSDTILATLVPRAVGLVLDGSAVASGSVRVFSGNATDSRQSAAVATAVRLGALELRNEPVRLESLGRGRAMIGTELLARLAATVDHDAGVLLLRPGGRVAPAEGRRYALILDPRSTYAAWGGRLNAFDSPSVVRVLERGRWTIDPRRGELVLE